MKKDNKNVTQENLSIVSYFFMVVIIVVIILISIILFINLNSPEEEIYCQYDSSFNYHLCGGESCHFHFINQDGSPLKESKYVTEEEMYRHQHCDIN